MNAKTVQRIVRAADVARAKPAARIGVVKQGDEYFATGTDAIYLAFAAKPESQYSWGIQLVDGVTVVSIKSYLWTDVRALLLENGILPQVQEIEPDEPAPNILPLAGAPPVTHSQSFDGTLVVGVKSDSFNTDI